MHRLIFLIFLSLLGCSSIQKMAVQSSTPILVDGSNNLSLEKNWDFFRDSAPANLKLVEMIYLQDKNNINLLASLVKGYADYAYAVPETLWFGDEMKGVVGSRHKKNAIGHYNTALDYGLTYLQNKGINKSDLLSTDEGRLNKLINKNLDKLDYPTVLFMAKSWGRLIDLQKENLILAAHLPRVKLLFDLICKHYANIENADCDLFDAHYASGEKTKELYFSSIKKYPKHLFVRLSFLEFSVIPENDKNRYEAEAVILKEEFAKWEDSNRDTLEDNSDYKAVEYLNLYNSVARKRFYLIEKNITRIFKDKT
jgi:hypothetical protein